MNVHGKPQICISKTIEQLHFNSDHHGESYFYFYGRWLILFSIHLGEGGREWSLKDRWSDVLGIEWSFTVGANLWRLVHSVLQGIDTLLHLVIKSAGAL